MTLYLSVITKCQDLLIEYIEMKGKPGDGKDSINISWDESEYARTDTGFEARFKGVYFDEEYANGRISELEGLEFAEIGVYHYSDDDIDAEGMTITDMEFTDGEISCIFSDILPHTVPDDECVFTGN